MKTLLVTLGDAAGIGPEITARLLARLGPRPAIRPLVVGEKWVIEAATQALGLKLGFRDEGAPGDGFEVRSLGRLTPDEVETGKFSARTGDAAFRWFDHAVECCQSGEAAGVVTAPISKEAINLAGHRFMGHTDILEKRTGLPLVMCLVHPKIFVAHVTDHMPLRKAIDHITPERIDTVVRLTWAALVRSRTATPRIAVAGLNPHAGEHGLLGSEETDVIIPAMEQLRAAGFPTSGPHPADTVFLAALQGRFDAVIAMYHDQGFGPMKTVDFAHGVNCSLGLPFARTSPDHGTAFAIAGQGVADPTSMIEAWKLAADLISDPRRKPRPL